MIMVLLQHNGIDIYLLPITCQIVQNNNYILLILINFRIKITVYSRSIQKHANHYTCTIITLNIGSDRPFANSVDPDQTPQIAASDQGLHCLLYFNLSWNYVRPTPNSSVTFLELFPHSTSLIVLTCSSSRHFMRFRSHVYKRVN